MVTSYRARTKWAVLVQSSPCPYKVGRGLVCVENNCYSRQSGNPETCKCLKQWIPAFAGMTYKCVIFFFLEVLHTLTKIIYWLAEKNNTESKLEINK